MRTSGKRTTVYTQREYFLCDKEMKRKLKEYCEANDIKKSQLIREAIATRLKA